MSKTPFQIKTYGCKVNTYDTGLVQKRLAEGRFEYDSKGEAPLHILNSCAVTAEATKEVIRESRRIKRKNPEAKVILTGCAAQVDGEMLDDVDSIDLIVANSHKAQLGTIIEQYLRGEEEKKVHRSNIFRNEALGVGGGEEADHTRSYLKIQDGCNSFCSFCVIPFARGKSRSLPVPILLRRIKELKAQGVNEVVLTGVHIGDYLDEETFGGPYALDDLVEQVLNSTEIPRIRLTSLEPIELTEKLMRLFKNPRLCSHFHMSLQSLSTPVLKGMRRNYSAEQVGESLLWIAREFPKAFVGLDVITGFPGETEELFQETFENLKRWPWTKIHVFPYSERKGTRADQMTEVVPWEVRKERAKFLRALSDERFDTRASEQVGEVKKVLLLKPKDQFVRSVSQDYWDVFLENRGDLKQGQIQEVKISGYERVQMGRTKGFLTGVVL